MGSIINLSGVTKTETCMQTVKGNTELFPEAEIEGPEGKGKYPVVSFTTNKGKGSGAQKLVASEFRGLVGVLRNALDSGFEEVVPENGYMTAAQVAEETISLLAIDPETDKPSDNASAEPTHVQFRVRGGKGSKPARIPLSEAAEVIAFLEGVADKVDYHLEAMNADADTPESDDDAGEGDEPADGE